MENTYQDRVRDQINEWVKGNPMHNKVDDECCPDFSCCKPDLLVDSVTRNEYKKAWEAGHDGIVEAMLKKFLGNAIEKYTSKNVYIGGQTDE